MADQIVSWGGIESKGTAGMGITGSLGILNTNTSSSVLLDITGSTNNSFTFRSNPILSGGQQNGLKVNVSTAGYDANGSNIAYNFQVGGTSYFTIANYGLATFAQSISTKGILIQGNPSNTTSLIVYAQGAAGNAIETGGSEGTVHLGSNTVNTKVNEILRITGKGTTSSTTALLVQNANATASLQVYDNNNITIGLGTTTFTSLGGNGNTGPTSSIYFDNAPNNHQIHHQIITRAAGQGSPYNYLRFPPAYNGTYEFIGAGAGVTLELTNSGSSTAMYYSHAGVSSNYGQIAYSFDPSARTTTFGGGSNNVHHLAPFTITLQGNKPFDNAGAANGGDVYIRAGAGSVGTSGISGSIYLVGNIVNTQNTIYVTGSRVGIGILTPLASLHISGSSNSTLFKIDSPAVNNIIFVSGSGNVGIGTSNPLSSLHISGASAVLTLSPQDPLPSGVPTGSFAVSSSAPPKPYFYDGTTWNALY